MELERPFHEFASFVTLTYAPEHVPYSTDEDTGERLQTLRKRDLQLWLKRLRKKIDPIPIRYFGCGEYGPETERPHYHAIVFGLGAHQKELLEATWSIGYVTISEADQRRMRYCAKYTLKALSGDQAPELRGRQKMFSVMSLRPPVGSLYAKNIATSFQTHSGALSLSGGLAKKAVRINGKVFPLDRTMMKYVYAELDLSEEEAKLAFPAEERPPATTDEKNQAYAANEKARRRLKKKAANAI